jgi:hypothetical protein
VCGLAAVLLLAASGWRVSETLSTLDPSGPGNELVTSAGSLLDGTKDATLLQSRRVVAEPVAAKRADIERLVAVAVAATALLLVLATAGPTAVPRRVRDLLDRSRWRPRGPPLGFVS